MTPDPVVDEMLPQGPNPILDEMPSLPFDLGINFLQGNQTPHNTPTSVIVLCHILTPQTL